MKKLKRGLALLLVVMMLVTTLPAAAMAAEPDAGGNPDAGGPGTVSVDEAAVAALMGEAHGTGVVYLPGSEGNLMVLVVDQKYKDQIEADEATKEYILGNLADQGIEEIAYFAEDGSYTIQLPEGTAFPYMVMFQWAGMDPQEGAPMVAFDTVDAVHEIAGHSFKVVCEEPAHTEDGQPENVDFNIGVNPLGYQYIKTVRLNEVDLTGYLAKELETLSLNTLLPSVNLSKATALAVDYYGSNYTGGDGQYIVVEVNAGAGTIDLSSLILNTFNRYSSGSATDVSFQLEIIDSDDQLNTDATRYIVPIKLSKLSALITLDAYSSDTKLNTNDNSWDQYSGNYTLSAPTLPVWDMQKVAVTMGLNAELTDTQKNGLTAQVYEGTYETADIVDESKNVTDQIWDKGASGYTAKWNETQSFTVVLSRNGAPVQVLNLSVRIDPKDVDFGFDMTTAVAEGETAAKIEVSISSYSSSNEKEYYLYPQNYDIWQSGPSVLKLRYRNSNDGWYSDHVSNATPPDYSDYAEKTDVTVYTGYYKDINALNSAVDTHRSKDITAEIWADGGTGYKADYTDRQNRQAFTIVIKDKETGNVAYYKPFYVYMSAEREYTNTVRVQPSSYLDRAVPSGSSGTTYISASKSYDTRPESPDTYYFTMKYPTESQRNDGITFPATGTYYVRFDLWDDAKDGTSKTAYDKISSITNEAGTDIKSSLFSVTSSNYVSSQRYAVDFSEDQLAVFTVNFKDGTKQVIRLRTLSGSPEKEPASIDTYFNVTGAKDFDCYAMPYHVDSSYQNGFQVIMVDTDKATLESREITPVFTSGEAVKLYRDHNETGEQILEMPAIKVQSGVPNLFSAASESGTHLRNYWITFIAKESGPKLWINGQNDGYHIDQATGLSQREVYIGYGSSSGYYDIFFANIGNADLEDLKVELSPNANIRLDDYWTVGDTKTLAPFTTTNIHQTNNHDDYYSQLENMAKIRIWPKDDTAKGDINAILTISAADQSPVSIKLTGKVGQAAIISSKVPDGVKFVPYSCLIQTNFQSRSGNDTRRPTFSIVGGALPANVSINEKTGEIYGVPRSSGTFNFTVGIWQNGQLVDSKSFSMKIVNNTDKDVWEASDGDTYRVLKWIGEETDPNQPDPGDPDNQYHYVIDLKNTEVMDPEREDLRTFVSNGPYIYYVKVFLDSVELEPGVDYTHEEGSTKLVLNEQTVGGKGHNTNGTHTLAIEFREGDGYSVDNQKYPGTLKRTSQNYTIEGGIDPSTSDENGNQSGNRPSGGGSNSKPNNSGNNGSNNGNNGNGTPSVTPPEDNNGLPFGDVLPNHWFYNDVYWAWENKYMSGVASDRFAPEESISQATIVMVLARLVGVDLTQFANVAVDGAAPGMWYTEAAAWAQQSGILPDNSTFSSEGAFSRDSMAIMLVKYMASMGVDTTVGSATAFADANQMTEAGQNAFQVLYQYGIFLGVGDGKMDPTGSTTRAQFAALVHRVSNFVASR